MQSIEYSQTILFYVETYEIIANIESNDSSSKITFRDAKIAADFFKVCKSWNLYGNRLRLAEEAESTHLRFYGSPNSHSTSQEYIMFMQLITTFLEGNFKLKDAKNE